MQKLTKPYDFIYKILLTGDCGVGKSALIARFTSDNNFNFSTDGYQSTLGVDFKIQHINKEEKSYALQIWDTAGQERFRTITSSYYRGAQGIIVVFDVRNPQSFEHVSGWISDVRKHSSPDVKFILVGNKSDADLSDYARKVSYETAKNYADTMLIPYYETSAKDNKNVTEPFYQLLAMMHNDTKEKEEKPKHTVQLVRSESPSKGSCSC